MKPKQTVITARGEEIVFSECSGCSVCGGTILPEDGCCDLIFLDMEWNSDRVKRQLPIKSNEWVVFDSPVGFVPKAPKPGLPCVRICKDCLDNNRDIVEDSISLLLDRIRAKKKEG